MKRTVLVTGASSGFGRETSKLFQKKGWNVIATMRSPEKEEELVKSENVLVTKLDVQDTGSIRAAINAGIEKFSRIDAVINNAGYGLMGVFESATKEQIKKQFDVNLFGIMDVIKEVLPHLRVNGGGTIINISSFGGFVGLPFGSLYNSSKFAVEGFSESLSHELFKLNIVVKIVEPGGVQTNFRGGLDIIKNEIPEYNPLVASFWANYSKATETLPKATAEDVANMIYNAATDGKTQLRYVAGDDAQFYIDTKMKNSDQEFVRLIRGFYIK
jgi:NAD(P)-dependent dehydrogenase (short-subunit alcohol dehydrogenase family)